MVRLAMLSRWHLHAKLYVRQLRESGKAEVVAVWDENTERGQAWAEELHADFHENLDDLLARPDVDGVVIDTPTNMHKDVIIRAAKAGKHIFTEKSMTLTKKDAEEAAAAVREAGVMFCISLVNRIGGNIQYIKSVIDKGILGDISMVRIRNGHSGSSAGWLPDYWYDEKTAGGGAMMDLGCHPMYIANYFLGKPKRIFSMFNTITGKPVEDNAQSSIEFENNSLCVVETSLVTYNTPMFVEVYGTKGTIMVSGSGIRMTTENMDAAAGEKGWFEPSNIPQNLPIPIHQFINALDTGDASHIHFTLEDGIALSELLEAAYISHKEGRMVYFNEPQFK